jgi:hypothetical protein
MYSIRLLEIAAFFTVDIIQIINDFLIKVENSSNLSMRKYILLPITKNFMLKI